MLKTIFQHNTKQAYILSTVHNKKNTLQISISLEKEKTDGEQVWHMHMTWHVYVTAIIHNTEIGFSDALTLLWLCNELVW
jgi:hypothetical protein